MSHMFTILNPLRLNTSDQMVWFTSDCHFNHDQEFIYSRRFGLNNVSEYNEYLIEVWNELVAPNDIVFDLGDFVFKDPNGHVAFSILSQLNGQHYLLWGNHNSGIKVVFGDQVHYPYTILDKVHYVGHYMEIVVDRQPIVLCHYPIVSWNDVGHGTWMLHGHCHNTLNDEQFGKMLEVGIDKFHEPIPFPRVKEILDNRPIVLMDQHSAETNPSRRW